PDGPVTEKLNDEPLPLTGNLLDTTHRSLVRAAGDPFEPLLRENGEPDENEEAPPDDPAFFDLAFALLRKFRGSPFGLSGPPVPTDFPPGERYCLVGTHLTGEKGPAIPVNAKARTWTPAQKRLVLMKTIKALRQIRDRKLVAKIRPNPDKFDFAALGGRFTIIGDCGELGPGRAGLTSPNGRADKAVKGFYSKVTLNGNYVLSYSDEQMVALVLHELVHVVQNLSLIGTDPKQTLIEGSIGRILREQQCFEVTWDRIAAGDIVLVNPFKCAEIAAAVRELNEVFEDLAKVAVAAGGLTAGQKRALGRARSGIRRLFLKYETFLKTVRPGNKLCEFRFSDGTREPLLKVVQRLLKEVYK
ncbi:MAG: hypothetical protein MI919_22055, partial [Holophagales bacterium]|nr:hypothetical protein [Holophagales bacterium]